MAKRDIYVDLDLNAQEIQNVSLEKLAATPGVLYAGRTWMNTTDDHIYFVENDGVTVVQLANQKDLNKFGSLIGTHDPAGGIPDGVTAGEIGSGVDEAGVPLAAPNNLQKGDFWIISADGTIAGIQGADELSIGDILMCTVDGSTTAGDWIGIQMNLNDAALGSIRTATLTAPLVAATPLSFAAAMAALTPAITNVRSVSVIEVATGEDITSGLRIDYTATEVESNVAIPSVTITVLGD